jgi:SnoaL-like protein
MFSRTLALLIILLPGLSGSVFAQAAGADSIIDRIAIQEKLLYAYAYAYDSKDCVGWSNLFTADAVLELGGAVTRGREAIRRWCIARQRDVVRNIRTHHNMTNIVFDQLAARRAETRTYCILTWQEPGDQVITVQRAFTYRDVIVKADDGKWLFKERKATDLP